MFAPFEIQFDKIWFLFVFLVAIFVAAKPEVFIRMITVGRVTSEDVSHGLLGATRIIAGLTAAVIAISFFVSLFAKESR